MTSPIPGLRTVGLLGGGVIGGGWAAKFLAQGYDVTVLERREGLGGRAYQLRDGGYTFDMGPSLITMPWLLDELYALPDVAAMAEALPGYEVESWFGIVMPKGVPPAVLERMNAAANKILRDPEVKKNLEGEGMAIVGGSAEIGIGTFDHAIQMQAKGQPVVALLQYGRYPGFVLAMMAAKDP